MGQSPPHESLSRSLHGLLLEEDVDDVLEEVPDVAEDELPGWHCAGAHAMMESIFWHEPRTHWGELQNRVQPQAF